MKKNIGKTDAIIRFIIAVIILYFIDEFQGPVQFVLGIAAGSMVITALIGICYLYQPFKINTAKNTKKRNMY